MADLLPVFISRTTAWATTSGVTDIGAGDIPAVILPITNPGRASDHAEIRCV
ncbi:Hypothetical protein Cul210932_1141 [Corynebacterium ulcerans]|nr:Hypothetical protein Cul210932_1141 [Corynebacterium ulcerans]